MKKVKPAVDFEEVLLSYTEMCYSVALALTRNPHEARDLARDVLTWAWGLRDCHEAKSVIKGKLLTYLRVRFLTEYGVNGHGACTARREESWPPMSTTA